MKRTLALVALFCSCIGFFIGHSARPAPPVPQLAAPPPPADPLLQKKARAAAIDVSARTPQLRVSDHVDVLATVIDPRTNERVAMTLMQNVVVLGIEPLPGRAQRLSLLVIPEEAEVLLLAQKLGTLDVTLRNPDDTDVIEERGRATLNTLLSGERMRMLMTRRGCCIEVIRPAR